MRPSRAWVVLFRPPNFLTVPGDVLAGYFLAGGVATVSAALPGLLVVVVAALLFYAAGLLLNDWADVSVDRVERPERPIPAGLVSRPAVLSVAVALLVAGIGLCFWQGRVVFLIGVALGVAIVNYNMLTKNLPVLGAANMGLCRALNFLLGAALASGWAWSNLVWWGVALLFLFIVAVTHLARREIGGRYFVVERWFPALVVVAGFFVYLLISPLIDWPAQIAVAFCFLLAAAGAARTAQRLPDRKGQAPGLGSAPPVPTPALIGRLISLLLPLQAALIVASGDGKVTLYLAIGVLALWPVKRQLGKVFYSS